MSDSRELDVLVTGWLQSDARSNGASERVLVSTLERVDGMRQDRSFGSWRFPVALRAGRTVALALLVGMLVVGSVVAVYVGSRSTDQPRPAPTVLVLPTNPPLPAASGVADSSIGRIEWTTVVGDATSLPASPIVATPSGFASIEPGIGGTEPRLWESVDGLRWSEAPLPVPATTGLTLVRAGEEYWIWSSDIRLWRSKDFAAWTEVDLSGITGPSVAGIDRSAGFGAPVTIGSTTVVPIHAYGTLALDELLGMRPAPGEVLGLRYRRDDPVLGDVRDVVRGRQTMDGAEFGGDAVGSIRLARSGSTISVVDGATGTSIALMDVSAIGTPAEDVADALNRGEPFLYPIGAVVITDGVVRDPGLPVDVAVARLHGAFLAMVDDLTLDRPRGNDRAREVWTSADGVDWTSLGAPSVPAPVPDLARELLPADGADLTLSALVMTTDGAQRQEHWTSGDGVTWERVGVAPSGHWSMIVAGPGRYLSVGDDYVLQTSPTTTAWTPVDDLAGIGSLVGESGGTVITSVVGDTVVILELPLSGARLMRVMTIAPTP